MNCNFTDWYKIENNASVLVIDKEVKDLEQYKNNKYQYIYLNGTLENAKQIMQTENSYIDLIKFFKELLTDDGSLFLAVDNKWGVKYISGNKSEHCNNIYDSLRNEFKTGKLFSKNELDKIVEETGFLYKKYYYPLPNYQKPNVIFTDKFLPDKNNSKLNYNVIYDENSLVLQDEVILLKIFIEEGKFTKFTNSYIIELSNKEIKDDVKYYSFNNMRKDKYSLILRMKDEYVEKTPKNKEALQHIKNINKNSKKLKDLGFNIAEEDTMENMVKSKFINLELLDKQIVRAIENKQNDLVYQLIDDWYEYISKKLQTSNNGIVKDGFIDLVFENTFYNPIDKNYIFFDQEWYQENVPIKFILYRAINNLYEHNPRIKEKLSKQVLIEKYGLNENIDEFIEREKKLQDEIIDKEKQQYYSKQYEYKITSEEIQKIIKDVKKLDKDNVELIGEIKRLEEKTKKQDEKIERQKNIIKNLNKTTVEKIKEKFFRKKDV